MSSLPSLEFMWDLNCRRLFGFCGLTLLVWDYLLTLGDEIEYIWQSPWTVAKIMFLLVRYGNIMSQTVMNAQEAGVNIGPSPLKFCIHFNFFASFYVLCSTESIHILVLVRACAIWGCKQKTTTMLISAYGVYLMFCLVFAVLASMLQNQIGFVYVDIIGTCVAPLPSYVWTFWLVSAMIDVTVFSITIRHLRKYSRARMHQYLSPLLNLLYRDAFMFFIVSILHNALTVALWTIYTDNPKYFLSVTFTLPFLNIAGLRLVLNLRRLNTQVSSYSTGEMSCEVDRQIQAFAFESSDLPVLSRYSQLARHYPLDERSRECDHDIGLTELR